MALGETAGHGQVSYKLVRTGSWLQWRKVSLQQDLKGWTVPGLGVLGIWLGEPLNILTFWCVCHHPHTALGLQGHEAMSGFFTCVLGL